MAATVLTPTQFEVLNMMSFVKSEDTYTKLKQAISDFFAKEADKELDRLWQNGALNDERIEAFRNVHERTPYK